MDAVIIDYKMSNLHSVQAACNKVGLSSVISSDPKEILDAKIAILPGVGAFGEAMSQLTRSGLDECIFRFVESGKPFIGICLGLQLLFEKSEEFGDQKGLGLVSGSVKKFKPITIKNTKFPVPQVGWNKVSHNNRFWENTPLKNNKNDDFMYFVHSYYVVPKDEEISIASTTYGQQKYCSAIKKKNIFATQFHPEKSGLVGLKIYQYLKTNLESHLL